MPMMMSVEPLRTSEKNKHNCSDCTHTEETLTFFIQLTLKGSNIPSPTSVTEMMRADLAEAMPGWFSDFEGADWRITKMNTIT